jgi:hypothetical protein
MKPPFTTDEFLDVFSRYNEAIWPMQIVAYVLALLAIGLSVRKSHSSGRVVALVLSFFWLWMGAVYHIGHFAAINRPAYAFGALFVVESAALFVAGVVRPSLTFGARRDASGIAGALMIVYAMIIYPIIGHLLGHGYPNSPSFGVAPCPTTIFTFGLLLWVDRKVPGYLLAIPFIWSLIGFFAAVHLGIKEDILLLVAGILGTAMIVVRNRRLEPGS